MNVINKNLIFDFLFITNSHKEEIGDAKVLFDEIKISEIVTLLGAVATFLVIILTRTQIIKTTEISRAQFWLEINKIFLDYDEIHFNLRDGGKWHCLESDVDDIRNDKIKCEGVNSKEKCYRCDIEHKDWSRIVSYLGLLEHCELMIQDGIIDQKRFELIFSYRIKNLIRNRQIRSKLIEENVDWIEFNNLLNRFNLQL